MGGRVRFDTRLGGGSADKSGRDKFSDVFTGGVASRILDGIWTILGPVWHHFLIFFWHFARPETGSEFYIDFSIISTRTNVLKWQKYVRPFAKSEKSWVSNFMRFMIKFGSHFGMVFPWFYHKVSILFLHWFSEPFFYHFIWFLMESWAEMVSKILSKSIKNLYFCSWASFGETLARFGTNLVSFRCLLDDLGLRFSCFSISIVYPPN